MIVNQTFKKEYTVSIRRIYLLSLFVLLVIIVLFVLPYAFIRGEPFISYFRYYISERKYQWDSVFFYLLVLRDLFGISLLIIIGAALHELLHGIFWIFFTKKGIKSLKFGFSESDFSPYIHCTEPIPVWIYRIGIILPGLILGIIPAVLAIFTGKLWLLMFGSFFSWAASGDFIIFYMIRNLKNNVLVQDHPERVGCYIM
ncbi:MAG TPA: DUF3267 domain-containing protein [Bacteroidales bacterium]|nr:DUF3267 domain-containing protein [Bacteroidales bacterium]